MGHFLKQCMGRPKSQGTRAIEGVNEKARLRRSPPVGFGFAKNGECKLGLPCAHSKIVQVHMPTRRHLSSRRGTGPRALLACLILEARSADKAPFF